MRYSEGSLRLLHDDLYQARYCHQMVNEEGRVIKKQVARNFHAASQKEAVLEKARIRDQLEREALIEDMLPCQKKNPKLSKFMFEQIDGMLKSGLIEPTTGAKYKSEANLILRFIDDVPVHKVTAAMVRKMVQDMLAKGYARETVARAHNALKRYLYEALEKGLIIAVPITRTVKPPRVERKDPNALDDETRKRLLSILDPSHEVVRQWGPEFAEWHRTHIPEGTPALSVGTTSMLGAIMRGTNLWSIVPAGMGHAIVSSDPSFVFQPLEDCPPPGPAAHMLLPKKALPWVGSAVDVLMQSVLNVVDADENLTRLHS